MLPADAFASKITSQFMQVESDAQPLFAGHAAIPCDLFGKSGDVGLSAGLIDHATGLPSPDGYQILPDHVIATVMKAAGIDYSITRVQPLAGLLA